MISCVHGRKLKIVLAELDKHLPVGVDSAQNPTTNREVDGGVGFILLPSGLVLEKITSDLSLRLCERYLLIVSFIYVRGLLWKKEQHGLGNRIAIERDELRRLGGEKYATLIKYGLSSGHLVRGRRYKKKERYNEYMLDQTNLSLAHQIRYELRTPKARKIRNEEAHQGLRRFAGRHPVYRRIADSIHGLTYDYTAAICFVAKIADEETKAYYRNTIERMLVGGGLWYIDGQGRNYTVVVQMPKKLRSYLTYQGESLHVVDIKSCHPLLHALLYPADCPEKKKYQTIVESGGFWEYLNKAAGSRVNLADEAEREAFKRRANAEIFYSRNEEEQKPTMLAQVFKREFPLLWAEMNARKEIKVAKPSGPVSREMQAIESEAVRDALETLLKKPFPLITIHDAVMTTKNGLPEVKDALIRSFGAIGLRPSLAVKQYQP